jgi:Na+/phosphate symporter
MEDFKTLLTAVGTVLSATDDIVRSGQTIGADDLRTLKQTSRTIFDRVKQGHFERISSGVCPPQAMMLFNDIASALSGITDLCWNVLGMPVRRSND